MQATCQHCGIEFHIVGSTRGRFCSMACYHAFRSANPGAYRKTPLVAVVCQNCGKVFERAKHQIRSEAQYCSKKCAGAINGPLKAAGVSRAPVLKTCDECGKEFLCPYKAHLRRRFCSRECTDANHAKNMTGENNPNFRHGRNQGAAHAVAKREYPQSCALCGFDIATQVHHIVPKSKGGQNNPENLIVLCPNHHAMAELGLLAADELAAQAQKVRLR